ncbi:MAG: ROK family protein [Kitasatospora sp.]|jgi:polyphosphate glucokinase|nr:ROK family protein [Kitasatospora sp.]
MQALGIDIGGSGVKAAPVDVATGKLLAERMKVETPQPSTPQAVAGVVAELTRSFSWSGPVGITFPGVVVDGITRTAANVDHAWIGLDAQTLLAQSIGLRVNMLNDADAAGTAEMEFGAGEGVTGTVLMLTFGTGIGSALFVDRMLVPNTEFGHVQLHGTDAEKRASDQARERHGLSWQKWAARVDEYLQHMEVLLAPQLIIIGGGVSRKSERFVPLLTSVRAGIVHAAMHNDAGIVGAAMHACPEWTTHRSAEGNEAATP